MSLIVNVGFFTIVSAVAVLFTVSTLDALFHDR